MDTIAPTSSIIQLDEILCQERMVRLDASTSIGSLLDFSWQTSNGEIISGQSDSVAMVNDTGLYVLILQDQSNGCRDTASYALNVSPNSILNMYYSVSQPACTGDSNGSIEVDSLDGGSGGYTYSLDGATQSSAMFQSLSAGSYLLSVVDTVGCVFDSLVVIPETVPISIELGDPKVIYIGEFASISAQIDFDSNLIANISWTPSIGFELCPNCLTYEVSPLETTTITATIEDSLGCVISDDVVLQVIEKGNVYVPNIFTPNGDQQNDIVQIFAGPGVTQYDFFGIFDRWGNQVYGAENFTYSELANMTWDGRLENEELPPAVFTYIIRYQLVNGKEETKTGDILLIR
jgi:gliding motility-associated-like protein